MGRHHGFSEEVNILFDIKYYCKFIPALIFNRFRKVWSPEFRMGQYNDDDHWKDAPHFMIS